jgi:sugar phosphate isomerase/epimerase
MLAAAAGAVTVPAVRTGMGLSPDCFGISKPSRNALEYLEYAWERGAGGVQAVLPSFDPAYLRQVRARAESLGMYLEIVTSLPKDGDTARFEATVRAAKEAGARCLRTVCLSGRRYETFSTLEQWKAFVAVSHRRLEQAARVLERERFPAGVENHKDWTVEEMVPLFRRYGSPWLGVCIDWGNNIALLDDPLETAAALAPFAVNSHIKDMAVEESEDGFLLAEVPLGEGFLDLPGILETIRRARPAVRYSLDMLTRDPLRIPCLTETYWATMPDRPAPRLAKMLKTVRKNKPRKPLARPFAMPPEQARQLEQHNVLASIRYAAQVLGL